MFSSMKAKIVVFYMAVLFVTLSVLGVFLYFSLSKIVHHSIDSSLMSRAKALATLVHRDNNGPEFNFSDEGMWEYNSPKSKHFLQIRQRDGTTLEKSVSLGNQELPLGENEGRTSFTSIRLNGEPIRVINFFGPEEKNQPATGKIAGMEGKKQGLIIQCAEDIDDRLDYLERYSLVLSLSILSILLISASGGFLIARKALKPVKEISETIGRISESNLSERIKDENIPTELKDLAGSFNRTFNRLERSFNRQRQFVSDASHELRTPLSVILSQSEILLRRERSVEEYKNGLTAVLEASKLMSDLIQKLLALARMDSDKVELKMENRDLGTIINEAVGLLNHLAAQKGITIHVSADEQYVISGDRADLLELFTNIIENAIKYNLPQGKIDISMRKEQGFVVTEVKDTGIGIPEKDLEKVFDRFYRVDKSRAKEIGGVGLGLSICNDIVKLHGGRIEIKSTLNEGTIVTLYLKGDGRSNRT